MPELPEVETIRIQLNQALKGLKIVEVEVLSPKNFIGSVKEVIGEKVEGVERRAKIVLIKLSGGKCLAVHLKLTGQLIYKLKIKTEKVKITIKNQKLNPYDINILPNKYTRVVITFDNGGKLYFNDLRKFGWMKLVSSHQLSVMNNELGVEPFDKEFTVGYLKSAFSKTTRVIKQVLLDQEKLAGVGNIYANEALFLAGIRPERAANSLTEEKIEKLRNEVIKVLKEAIGHKGTSDRDEAYRQISGEKGRHQNYLKVYGRGGQNCFKCGGGIVRIKIGGRGTFYCPKCQR